jgi:hypothetical protein
VARSYVTKCTDANQRAVVAGDRLVLIVTADQRHSALGDDAADVDDGCRQK